MEPIYVGAGLGVIAYLLWYISKEIGKRKR